MCFSPRVESSSGNNVKRIAVVGRGMIGCSIFKYLSKTVAGGEYKCEFEIYCIGPDEHPIDDKVDVEDVADAIIFLLSDKSRMLNGITMPVDGGFCAV